VLSRRRFVAGTTVVGVGAVALGTVDWARGKRAYDRATTDLWRLSATDATTGTALQHELIRLATLAPSSHNTQCWKFRVASDAITVLPDLSRRCRVVDPDDHHLFVSLGCASENLVQAAAAHGFHATARFDASAAGGYRIALEPTAPQDSALYRAIAERQVTRGVFDGKALSSDEMRLLERAGSSADVQLDFVTAAPALEQVLSYVVAGNTAQMDDPAFVAELEEWIRFGRQEAVDRGDGLFSGASGSASIPRWLGRAIFSTIFTKKGENEKYAAQIRSAAGIAIFSTAASDAAHWIDVGRCYERFALQCTALGIRTAMVNQPVEVAAVRPQFAAHLGLGGRRPDLVVRFGRGPLMPRSLRRPVAAVLV
jgi:hypothetical protein